MNIDSLAQINQLAHVHTFHPSALQWEQARNPAELAYLSRVVFGDESHADAAVAYIVKELAQLAEIERHVSAVMTIALSDLPTVDGELAAGSALHGAISAFAAEEINHSDAFYRYVRELGERDFVPPSNLFSERLAPYLGDDSPFVKLAALCCTAYIGESIITVLERHARALDPELRYFLSKLLHLHNLDEARHVQTDHWIMTNLIPSFSDAEQERMRAIIGQTEKLNFELAGIFAAHAKEVFGIDYTDGNATAGLQIRLTLAFSRLVLGGDRIVPVDQVLDEETRGLVEQLTGSSAVHV